MELADDLLTKKGIQILRLGLNDMRDIVDVSLKFNLDFDDAYQYVAAEKYNLTLSFDTDFDRTDRGSKTPREVLKT